MIQSKSNVISVFQIFVSIWVVVLSSSSSSSSSFSLLFRILSLSLLCLSLSSVLSFIYSLFYNTLKHFCVIPLFLSLSLSLFIPSFIACASLLISKALLLTLPHASRHPFLKSRVILSKHLRRVDIRRRLVVRRGQHRYNRQHNRLHRLHRRPPLAGALVPHRVIPGAV